MPATRILARKPFRQRATLGRQTHRWPNAPRRTSEDVNAAQRQSAPVKLPDVLDEDDAVLHVQPISRMAPMNEETFSGVWVSQSAAKALVSEIGCVRKINSGSVRLRTGIPTPRRPGPRPRPAPSAGSGTTPAASGSCPPAPSDSRPAELGRVRPKDLHLDGTDHAAEVVELVLDQRHALALQLGHSGLDLLAKPVEDHLHPRR